MSSLSSDEKIKRANELKVAANELLQKCRYNDAIAKYTEAIELHPGDEVFWANRAQANIKAENYGSAIADAEQAIKLNAEYAKAHHRLGVAKMGLGHYQDALPHFRRVCILEPQDTQARLKLQEVVQLAKKVAFEEAIRFEEESSFMNLDYESMEVDSSYDGPVISPQTTVEEVKNMITAFKAGKKLHKKYFWRIMFAAKAIFETAPTLIEVPVSNKFTVCGDTHGQFYDFVNIFELNGYPSETNPYLFNGDFVDRGNWGVEVLLTLLAFKVALPNHMWMNRGNHETSAMNRLYGFNDEIRQKFDERAVNCCCELFNLLPLAHVVQQKVFVVHGGLFAKDGVTLADIKAVDRRRQPPDSGIMADILWSDPAPPGVMGRQPSKRGNGVCFGADVTYRFLDSNGLQMVVRSHEVKDKGYEFDCNNRLVTVFSAPNYMDQVGNLGAYIVFDADAKPTPHTFAAVKHPDVRPMSYSRMGMFGM